MRLRSTLALAAALLAGCGDNLEPAPDLDMTIAIELDTSAPVQVAAGDSIEVNCTLFENDITTMVPAEIRVVSEDHVLRMGDSVVARTVGMVEVACALPDRGLVDPTPAQVEIVAGPAANVVTTVTPDPVVAGNDITATCVVYDGYGNLIEDAAPELQLSPTDAANTVTDLSATMIRAGHYVARCALPGTTSNNAGFEVIPNLPASLVIQRWPDLPVYAVGNAVQVTHIVSDRYGNEIVDAVIARSVSKLTGVGPVVPLAADQWRFDGEGRYQIDVSVDEPTDMGVVLAEHTEVLVNSLGPAITCANDASMLMRTPGTTLTVTGQANDANGVASLTVNGNPVAIGTDGSFSAQITTRFGMNFVHVSATDSLGEPTSKVCTFLISGSYANASQPIDDTVTLKLTQPAVDDGNRSAPINSFGELLYTIINSSGMSNTIHSTLLQNNPLKPHSCDSQTCLPFVGCACNFSSGIEYRNRSIPGPNEVDLALVSGGLSAHVRIPNLSIDLGVWGKVGPFSYDTAGWVDISYIDVALTLDTFLSTGGQPKLAVRSGSVSTSVGTIGTRFNGVDGWIINNIVVPLANNQLRDLVANTLRDFITTNFNAALDGVIGNLDIATLGTTFNVPRIDGSGTVPMTFGLRFSYLSSSVSRMLFGIGTRFSTTAANAFPTLGVAMPAGTVRLDPTVSSLSNTAVSAHVGVLNGALHALWRANFFVATIDGATLGQGLPSGLSLQVTTRLPPVAMVSGSQVRLHLGALDLMVQHPDLPPDLSVRLGAEAHASVTLVGDDLVFGGIVIDDLHFSTDTIALTPGEQQSLEDTLTALVQQFIDSSLNDALPAIPIPAFTIPATLGQFGLPVNDELGILSPALTVSPQHFVLRGRFGLRP